MRRSQFVALSALIAATALALTACAPESSDPQPPKTTETVQASSAEEIVETLQMSFTAFGSIDVDVYPIVRTNGVLVLTLGIHSDLAEDEFHFSPGYDWGPES